MTVLFIGHAVLDHVFHVPALDSGGGKGVATGYLGSAGGMALRAALAATALRDAQHSPAVRLVSACGADEAGATLREQLAAAGLPTTDVATVPGARTSVSAVLVEPGGERRVHNFRGDAFERAPLPAEGLFDGAHAVQVDPRWPRAAQWALEQARRRGLLTMLDAEVAEPAVLRALVPLADWLVFSSAGWQAWCDGPQAALRTPADLQAAPAGAEVVVSRGADGVWWRRPDGSTHVLPAPAVQAQDTNGAGDALHGALLLFLAEGLPPERALTRAVAAAALACTGRLPSRAELLHFMDTPQ